jgi:hypothetical protein
MFSTTSKSFVCHQKEEGKDAGIEGDDSGGGNKKIMGLYSY